MITINKLIAKSINITTTGGAKCDALCFTAEEANSTVRLTQVEYPPEVRLQTSTDGNTWTPYTIENNITLTNVGDKVYFKAIG